MRCSGESSFRRFATRSDSMSRRRCGYGIQTISASSPKNFPASYHLVIQHTCSWKEKLRRERKCSRPIRKVLRWGNAISTRETRASALAPSTCRQEHHPPQLHNCTRDLASTKVHRARQTTADFTSERSRYGIRPKPQTRHCLPPLLHHPHTRHTLYATHLFLTAQ